jgi:signal transduction histidine kinase
LRVRSNRLNARLNISSQPGGGTTIQLTVPLNGGPDSHARD